MAKTITVLRATSIPAYRRLGLSPMKRIRSRVGFKEQEPHQDRRHEARGQTMWTVRPEKAGTAA